MTSEQGDELTIAALKKQRSFRHSEDFDGEERMMILRQWRIELTTLAADAAVASDVASVVDAQRLQPLQLMKVAVEVSLMYLSLNFVNSVALALLAEVS